MQRSIEIYLVGKRPRTKEEYRQLFTSWFAHLASRSSEPASPSVLDATSYVEALSVTRGEDRNGAPAALARKTVCKRVSILRKLYTIANHTNEASANPFLMVRLKKPREPEKRRCEVFPRQLVRKLFRAQVCLRNRALFAVLFGGGLRIGEAMGLSVGDVERFGSTVILFLHRTKSGEAQEQPLPTWASRHVRRYLRVRKLAGAKPADPLFMRTNGTPMTIRSATCAFVKEAEKLGVKNLYPHSARRWAITRLLEQGLSLLDVQVFSRHADVSTIADYDKRRLRRDRHPSRHLKI